MNTTLVNTHDLVGGAERCSYDIATELYRRGDKVTLIVGKKYGEDEFVHQLTYRYLDYQTRNFFHSVLGLTETTMVAPLLSCFRHPALKNADIYNIHNMHGSYWNLWTLPILTRRAPVVLTLHDEWLLGGDCAYTYDCKRWQENCGACPQVKIDGYINRYAIGGRDNTRMNLWIKRLVMKMVPTDRLTIVSPSHWLANQARHSSHLKDFDIRCIRYGIDLDLYRPLDKTDSRLHLGLPVDGIVVLAIASNIDDRRKNFQLIQKLLLEGKLPADCTLVLVGKCSEEDVARYRNLPVHLLGYLSDKLDIVRAFSAADCSLLLSKADNLPYVGIESLACGCPIIAASAGGMPELIQDGVNGWLVSENCDVEELEVALGRACSATEQLKEMGQNAREFAKAQFAMDDFIGRHRSLFEELIQA